MIGDLSADDRDLVIVDRAELCGKHWTNEEESNRQEDKPAEHLGESWMCGNGRGQPVPALPEPFKVFRQGESAEPT